MDSTPAHEGQFDKLTPQASDFAKIVEIMTRGGRRAFVEVDGQKLATPEELTPARVYAASEVDVSSYYADPAKPHFGRCHFVYLVADRSGVRFFGDSHSPEVMRVCDDLGRYLKADTAPARSNDVDAWGAFAQRFGPSRWPDVLRNMPPLAFLTAAAFLVLLAGFLLGRASVPSGPDVFVSSPPPVVSPATMPVDAAAGDANRQ